MNSGLPIPYLDGHVHVFPRRWQERIYGWFDRAGWQVRYSDHYEEDVWHTLSRLGAVGASILVYAHKPGIARELNRWLYEWGGSRSNLHFYGTVHPDDPDLKDLVVEALDRWHFEGFKIHANVQAVRLDDLRLVPLYDAVVDRGRSLVVHAGREPHRNATVGVEYFEKLMARYPSLRVQVAHLGYDQVDAFVRLLERYPGVYLDTAAIPSTRLHIPVEKLSAILRTFPDRIIYGSDMPILEEPVEAHWRRVWDAAGDERHRNRVFRDNLETFWRGR